MRRIAFATVVLMAASLTACGGASKTADSSSTESSSVKSSDTSSTGSSAPPSAAVSSDDSSGSGSGSDYCTELKAAKSQFHDLDVQAFSEDQFKQLTSEFDALEAAAPADVKGDWATLATALKQVDQILSDAGLSFKDLKQMGTTGQLPDGVTAQDLQKLGLKLQKAVQGKSFERAARRISASAKSECGIKLGD
jgi:hypothetical protein